MITIIGGGNIDEIGGMTVAGKEAIDSADIVIYQSSRQSCCPKGAMTLDDIFENSEDFDDFTANAIEYIGRAKGKVSFVAIGDGVNNNICRGLCLAYDNVNIIEGHICSCVSTAVRLGGAAVDSLYYISGYDYENCLPETDRNTVVCGVDSSLLFWDIKAKLLDYYDEDTQIYINKSAVQLKDAEYTEPCDIFLQKQDILEKKRYSYKDLMEIVRELREKCPWDREQTHQSIRTNLIEECYELYEAIDKDDSAMMLEEMGDVLLQICLHNIFECEHGDVTEDDVTTLICQKLIRRHPHVYGQAVANTQSEVKEGWDEIKKQEYSLKSKGDELRHISKYLPALMRAYKAEKKAGKLGIAVEGDINKAIDAIIKGEDVKNNCVRFMLLAVKLVLSAGEHPYTLLNDGVNCFIEQVEEQENDKNTTTDIKINIDDVCFYGY